MIECTCTLRECSPLGSFQGNYDYQVLCFRTCDLCDIYSSLHDFFSFQRGRCMMQLCWHAESGFLRDLNMYAFSPMGVPLCIYGDPAYPLRIHLQAPFRNTARLSQQMELFNKSMSKVRMSVELIFGDVINDFKFLDF